MDIYFFVFCTSKMAKCAIPYCEFEDLSEKDHEDAKFIPICGKLHVIHIGCFKELLKKEKYPKCPICRDDFVYQMKHFLHENPLEEAEEVPRMVISYIPHFIDPPPFQFCHAKRHTNTCQPSTTRR